jgi:hypothetical protein
MSSIAVTHDHSQERYFQPGTALNRLLQEAPYFPRCSDNKTATRQRPREYAVRYPYMQVNRQGFVSWLIFDLDHKRAMIWEDAGLPTPNMIVQNRVSGHSHLYYAIVPVCTTVAARAHPIAYMKAIYEAFAARLDADTEFHSGPVAKTPGHRWWVTSELHNHVYELGELADCVELAPPRPYAKTVPIEDIAHSRHKLLFEFVRQYAYAIVTRERGQGNLGTFTRLLEAFAHNRNNFRKMGFTANLPLSSIRATVKSIARWTWERYTGCGRCHRGAMRLDKDLPLAERQKLAAQRTHGARRKETESKIRAACRILKQRGQEATQAAVGRLVHMTRQTVAGYKHIINEITTAPVVAALAPAMAAKHEVKYGAHQVTGGVAFVCGPVSRASRGMDLSVDAGGRGRVGVGDGEFLTISNGGDAPGRAGYGAEPHAPPLCELFTILDNRLKSTT